MWWEIIEMYTQPGQLVLDPMGGIGSTLIAAMMGRNVICNEMETHFYEPMAGFHCDGTFSGWEIFHWDDYYSDQPYPSRCHKRMGQHPPHWVEGSWQKMQRHGPMLGHQMGQALIIRGDARMLPIASADAIVTSPPYENSAVGQSEDATGKQWERFQAALASGNVSESTKRRWKVGQPPAKSNNLVMGPYTRPVDAVITSPPYEEHHQGGPDPHPERMEGSQNGQVSRRYVDAVVTSPPFGEENDNRPFGGLKMVNQELTHRSDGNLTKLGADYQTGQNIGNLRGNAYWESMEQVYRECHRVLIPGGVMVLVVKGYTRDKKYVDLPGQTADLIETLGFQVFDRWTREVPLSFWRTLQKQKGNWDDALRHEHVIAARKS
jgi:DNA modification methylase